MTIADITGDSVNEALDEFDQIGREAFLRRYGIDAAKGYYVLKNGKKYDAKAIVGAAHGKLFGKQPLRAEEFQGGEVSARILRKLGFQIEIPTNANQSNDGGWPDISDWPAIASGLPNPRFTTPSGIHRYDELKAEEWVKAGKVPPPPDFSAPTHEQYRDTLVEVLDLARRQDLDGLRQWDEIESKSSSRTAILRYRDFCIRALERAAATRSVQTERLHMTVNDGAANLVLYGPPGTGKTYATIDLALEILDPPFFQAKHDDRKAMKVRFDELATAGDLRFVTFHQSFSYEDFIEGLRAERDDDGQLNYVVVDGVFKSLCNAAVARVTQQVDTAIDPAGRRIWKMSLGNTRGIDAYIFDECIENKYVLLGWGGSIDFRGCANRDEVFERFIAAGKDVKKDSYAVTAVANFLLKMKEGDILIVSDGNVKFRAIGEVVGEYRPLSRDEEGDDYGQCRPVKWLRVYAPSLPLDQLMKIQFSQMALYPLQPAAIDVGKLSALLSSTVSAVPSASGSTGSVFQVGERFGTGYEVAYASNDVVELIKPNKNRLPIGMSLLKALASYVREGKITLADIRAKTVFEKLPHTQLEPYLVNGYENILGVLVERLVTAERPGESRAPAPERANPKVLIIDEINRGNISRIFGELITLIEPSKRAGAAEALHVTLPYSKERFSVPGNLYLIGTMNTADRSLTALDIALRRRFLFREMEPQPQLLAKVDVLGVNIGKLLSTMNDRIEVLLDRDHRLGHTYFLPLIANASLGLLAKIFRHQILPLLQEYFFEDWNRISLVLNDHRKVIENRFVTPRNTDISLFGDQALIGGKSERWLINEKAFNRIDAYMGVVDHHMHFTDPALKPESDAIQDQK